MGSHYTDRFLRPSAATRHILEEHEHAHDHDHDQNRTHDTPSPGTTDFGGPQP
jgi:hypothetical protein